MTKTGSSGTMALLLCMTLLAGVFALTMLGSTGVTWQPISRAEVVAVPDWLDGRQTTIEPGLVISPHATKHAAEALDAPRIYAMLLAGKCTAAEQYCNSDGKRLYLCFDSVTGLLGGLFIQNGMIDSGWGSRASYWAGKVRGDAAPFKPDKCYRH